jgi:hypothetical protein
MLQPRHRLKEPNRPAAHGCGLRPGGRRSAPAWTSPPRPGSLSIIAMPSACRVTGSPWSRKLMPRRARSSASSAAEITGMRYRLVNQKDVEAMLALRLDPKIARQFGKDATETVKKSDGMLVDQEITGEDVGTRSPELQIGGRAARRTSEGRSRACRPVRWSAAMSLRRPGRPPSLLDRARKSASQLRDLGNSKECDKRRSPERRWFQLWFGQRGPGLRRALRRSRTHSSSVGTISSEACGDPGDRRHARAMASRASGGRLGISLWPPPLGMVPVGLRLRQARRARARA